jgi:hypothetical protein
MTALLTLPTRLHPSGNALTETVSFEDRDGVEWLVYIEGLAVRRHLEWPPRTRLPGRALRFDSAVESRRTGVVPAGSPYLGLDRLAELLDRAQSVTPLALPH